MRTLSGMFATQLGIRHRHAGPVSQDRITNEAQQFVTAGASLRITLGRIPPALFLANHTSERSKPRAAVKQTWCPDIVAFWGSRRGLGPGRRAPAPLAICRERLGDDPAGVRCVAALSCSRERSASWLVRDAGRSAASAPPYTGPLTMLADDAEDATRLGPAVTGFAPVSCASGTETDRQTEAKLRCGQAQAGDPQEPDTQPLPRVTPCRWCRSRRSGRIRRSRCRACCCRTRSRALH